MAIVRTTLGVLLASTVLGACSTVATAPPKPEAPTIQAQVGRILDEVSQLRPGVVGTTCTGSKCKSFGSSSAPLVAGLNRAATQLQGLQYTAHELAEVIGVIAQLRLMANLLRQEESLSPSNPSTGPEVNIGISEAVSLNAALSELRRELHLPAKSGESFL